GGGVQQGGTAVHLLVNHLVDLFILRADYHNLGLLLSHNQHLIHHDAVQQNHQDAVQHLLCRGIDRLNQQQRCVPHIDHHRNGEAEQLVQDNRRDVHASGGS